MKIDKIIGANNTLERPFQPVIKRGGVSSSKMLDTYFENIQEDIANLYSDLDSSNEAALESVSTAQLQIFTMGHILDSLRSYVESISGSNELYIDMYAPNYIDGALVGGGDFSSKYGQLIQYTTEIDILDSSLEVDTNFAGLTIGMIYSTDINGSYYEQSASGITYENISSTWNVSAPSTGWMVLNVPRLYEHQESNSVLFHPYPLYGLDIHSVKVLIDGSLVEVDLSHCPGWNGHFINCAGPCRLWHDNGIVTRVYIEASPSQYIEEVDMRMGLSYIALKEYSFSEGSLNIDLMDYLSTKGYTNIASVTIEGWRETELAALNINIAGPFVTIETPSTKPVVVTGFKFSLL